VSFSVVETTLPSGIRAKGLVDGREESKVGPHPVVVDFNSAKIQHRLRNNADGEAIVKAIGLKRSARSGVLVYDFTAGLGTEAFLLACAGFSVVAFERDEKIFEILEDGLRRFRKRESEGNVIFPERLELEFRKGDAVQLVEQGLRDGSLRRAYAVTVDPMFEGESTEAKSLPKKEMALLRRMLPPSDDTALREMMAAAFSVSDGRVVVKRPNGSVDIAGFDSLGRSLRPSHRLEGKTARFDIYSCR
jgi:16S rRNA (guanine1516-N2)-methyltransferase